MIKIVTDTDSNMPQHVVDEFDIRLAPIHILFGNETVREHFEITPSQAYERMAAAKELPRTSQPPIGEFASLYEAVLAEDPEATILSLHISGGVSGTVESARQAAALLPEADIRVFDTRTASLAQALIVRQAAVMARQGASADAIMAQLGLFRDNSRVFFAVKTLEYLAKGGRIGRASHLLASTLAIKPILQVDGGVINSHSRYRTWTRTVAALRDLALAEIPPAGRRSAGEIVQLGVLHAVNPAEAQTLCDDLSEQLEPDVLLTSEVGPGLGVHVGPGTLGVCWLHLPAKADTTG